jgi:hypothetical protein
MATERRRDADDFARTAPYADPPRIHTLVTGEVAQRFVARERTLTEDRAFIDAMVRLLSAS